jgi:hypothetical protein
MLIPLCSKEDIVKDIHTVIRKEGKDELRYELPNDHELIIKVLASERDDMEISVERLDEYGNTTECSTDNYSCDDKCLIAMIENALLA